MLPSISVITPSYNQGQYIKQTVESVLSQQYPNLEYIVVDALSTDQTLDILTPFQDQLTLIVERDRGQSDAINKGLRRATGDIVCWLNSDDYLLPGTLHKVGSVFEKYPDRLWLTGDCQVVNENGETIQEPIRLYKKLLRSLSPTFYLGITNCICQPATFWRRSVHESLGYIDESLHYTMDYDWWLRLLKLQIPVVSPELFTAFRIHSASKGGSQFDQQFTEDYAVCRKYWPDSGVRLLHKWHNQAIIAAYRLIK